jgi:class 3 adenylate cyclase/pimeloyl-ACP methyl ester carboxylesterase
VAELPEIRYAECDGRDVAYQVLGSGAVPFVGYFDIGVHLDLMWTDPAWAQEAERFNGLWRVAFFQMRGIGLSEPVDRRPTLEEQASDLAVVMDAAGMPRGQVLASGATAPGAVVFAASHPDRVDGLVLNCPYLSMPLADHPDLTGWEPGAARRFADWWLENVDRWGSGVIVDGWDPVIASPRNYRQLGLLERTAASRPVARAYVEAAMRSDVSRIAAQVQCPVRVLHMPTNRLPEAVSRHAAELFPKGELRVLRPSQPGMSWGESLAPVWEHNAELVSGRATTPSHHLLATVMFEDVVGSTTLVSRIGDDAWRELRVRRDRLVLDCVEEHGGRIVSTAGDGSMCALPGPAVAIRCAERLHELVNTLDLQLRVGIHTGECVRIGNELAGLAVHIAARIGAAAEPGETLVSRTVSDLVAGSGLGFAPRGNHQLKGVPGDWELLAATGGATMRTVPAQPPEPPQPRMADRLIVTTARRAPRLLTALNRLDSALSRRRT